MNATLGWLENVLGLIYPNVCQICRAAEAFKSDGFVCNRCLNGRDGLQRVTEPFCDRCGLPFEGNISGDFTCANCEGQTLHYRHARAAVRYSGVVREAIHGYKYNHAIWFEPLLSRLLVEGAAPELAREQWDYLVPIPLHWTRRFERTFNQADRLARSLSRATGIPLHAKFLKRTQRTDVQARLTRAERLENVNRAFQIKDATALAGRRVVLIDDVLTTGATANACARILTQNGAATVDVWTVARNLLK